MWNKATIYSAHLYQLPTCADVDRDGSINALLLYAHAEAPTQPDLDVVVQGNRIGARTPDLNQPWDDLRARLDNVATWLEQ